MGICEQQEKEALDDLSMELELADEDEPVLCDIPINTPYLMCAHLIFPRYRYRVGEAFVQLPLSRAQKRLERDMENIDKEVSEVNESMDECDKGMKELKLVLYGKFGSAINLEE